MATPSTIDEAVAVVRSRATRVPEVALVLGSGLGAVADAVQDAVAIPTGEIPGYPAATVAGHAGRLVLGRLEDRDVAVIQGRIHLYEGHPASAVTFPIRLVHALGARRMLVTNAAGGVNPLFGAGSLMFITDHVNFTFASPLAGPNEGGGPRFPDMSAPYDPEWTDRAEQIALREGIDTFRGVYVWTSGPSYETKAEIRALARLGADAVGMSTVPEVIAARWLGMSVLGISMITNPAAGLGHELLDHEDVLRVGQRRSGELERLVRAILREL